MQLISEKSNETSRQQQQQQQHTHDLLQAKMHKFYPPKPKINAFNDLFACYLCRGYMINPTAIDVCMHTYCRSCIARHLAADCYCPQCKVSSNGGKAINMSNLKSDDILRSIIFKLVPGLYQKERERLVQFVNNTKNEGNLIASTEQSLNELLERDDDFFSPTDPISLSLEFHPILAEQCPEGSVPPVRYLQCPASVKVQHLKRFLCSKFNIDPCCKRVGIDIIYDDEILPSDFTLMDVVYCYQWQRNAPLKLTYRILIYNEDVTVNNDCDSDSEVKKSVSSDASTEIKTVSFASHHNGEETSLTLPPTLLSPPEGQKPKSSNKSPSAIRPSLLSTQPEVPVKVTISRKSSAENKKTVSKKPSYATDEFVVPTTTTNGFKSLRSNDIRFSNYTITSTSSPNTTCSVPSVKKEKISVKEEKPTKCDIVVSIPHNQVHDEWDSKPLSELKTASKKSPNFSGIEATKTAPPPAKKNRNVPKLKIELNSLKTKLIEKPKSADIRLDTLLLKHHKPRKFSLDEPQPVVDKVDLETYVKNIGLKPIEVQTNNGPETPPNASPMSSSSSTTSSSTGNFNFNGSADISSSSSSSHKKRKKKHSKNSRESKDSKRKKLHAEISSHSAEESLKMKVKLTPPINLKSLKLESKKPPPPPPPPTLNLNERAANSLEVDKPKAAIAKVESKSPPHDKPKDKSKAAHAIETKKSKSLDDELSQQGGKKLKDIEQKSSTSETKLALKPYSGKSLTKEFDDDEDLSLPDSTSVNKPLVSIKETPLPQSPPLPPSLFKTTTLTFSPFSPNITSVAKPKAVVMPKDSKEKPRPSQMKPIAPKPMPTNKLLQPSTFKSPQFAVPNAPSRFTAASNTTKFLSTPTSIASAANKHLGNMLKRSMSLDEHKNSGSQNKQPRLEKPSQITVSAYGSNLHMTKVEIPATPTSSTAKATYEIPLYSPLSASYNPKCSFSVNSTTTVDVKTTKGALQNTLSSFAASPTALKANKQTESKKSTSNVIKSSDSTKSHMAKCKPTSLASTTTLMGPPMPIQKMNSSLNLVPISMKSPPPLTSSGQLFTSNSVVASKASAPAANCTKATTQHTPAVLSTASLSMVNYKQSKVLLAHVKPTNLSDIKMEAASIATPTGKLTVTTTNSLTTEKPKTSSLREFRLPSRESAPDILDLSPSTKTPTNGEKGKLDTKTPATTHSVTSTATNNSSHMISNSTLTSGSTLEMALNKIKQNMSTTTITTTSTTLNHIPSVASSTSLDNGIKKPELAISSSSPVSDDLQNLHLLSESATAREKIAISSAVTTSTSSSSVSPYEKVKITQNTLVRQQNASVRNIPNPSALAFRNQQPVSIMPPMVTIAAGVANKLNDLDKPLLLKTPSPPKSPYSINCSTGSTSSTSSISPSRSTNKKHHPSIDQVAASLNMRASAAAEASAKAQSKLNDETTLVTSTSSTIDGKQIKLESGEQNDSTGAVLPSSTTSATTANTSRPLLNNVEIKQEPDEKVDDNSSNMKVKGSFVNVTTTTTTTTKSAAATITSNKSSIVEHLVTSVINVTTPTTNFFTARSSVEN